MPFFRQFPKTTFDFTENGIDTQITDLFRYVKPKDRFLDDASIYEYYEVTDGSRPDVVSNTLYGTPDFHWTFFIVNDHLREGHSNWALSPDEFKDYIEREYQGVVVSCKPVTNYSAGDFIYTGMIDCLVGRFNVGDIVTGTISGVKGTVAGKDIQSQQLLIQDIVPNPLTGASMFFSRETGERIAVTKNVGGADTIEEVALYDRWEYRDAPHHYLKKSDGSVSYNAKFIDEAQETLSTGVVITHQPDTTALDEQLVPVSYYEWEVAINDAKSRIRVVKPSAISLFARTYTDLLNSKTLQQ